MEPIGDLTHEEKVGLYVAGLCERLANKGLLEPGRYGISDSGRALFEQLEASGFRPTDYEIELGVAALQRLCAEGE